MSSITFKHDFIHSSQLNVVEGHVRVNHQVLNIQRTTTVDRGKIGSTPNVQGVGTQTAVDGITRISFSSCADTLQISLTHNLFQARRNIVTSDNVGRTLRFRDGANNHKRVIATASGNLINTLAQTNNVVATSNVDRVVHVARCDCTGRVYHNVDQVGDVTVAINVEHILPASDVERVTNDLICDCTIERVIPGAKVGNRVKATEVDHRAIRNSAKVDVELVCPRCEVGDRVGCRLG